MTRRVLRCAAPAMVLAIVLAQGCSNQDDQGPLGIGVNHKDGPGLPVDVTSLTINVTPYASTAAQCSPSADPRSATFPVAEMPDLDGNGYKEATLHDLPHGCPLFAEIQAYDAASTLVYSGRADGIVLIEGERRFVEMTVSPVDSMTLLSTALEQPAFGLTATSLAETDGRVLIAGGFTTAAAAACPAGYEDAAFSCFALTATANAYVFEQGAASARALASGSMMVPRAMHSANRLADGRVLIAGGVQNATLVIRDDTGATSWSGYEIVDILPGIGAVQNTFEIFDPNGGATALDPERDGDLTRGAFQGRFDIPTSLGAINYQRFAHGSALVTSDNPSIDGYRVILTGGFGPGGILDTTGVPSSIDVFSMDGVTGSYDFLNGPFPASAAMHSAPATAFVGDTAWGFGGSPMPGAEGHANANVAVVEKWQPTDDWPVSPVLFFDFDTVIHPEYVRLFGHALEIGSSDDTIAVTGWYGARCDDVTTGTPTPTYTYVDTDTTPIPTYICPPALTPDFTMTLAPSPTPPAIVADASPTDTPHALAEAIRLTQGTREGQVIVLGGISDVMFTTTRAVDLYTGVDMTGLLVHDAALTHTLNNERALCAAAELNGGNVVIVGGVDFDLAAGTLTILDTLEYLNW